MGMTDRKMQGFTIVEVAVVVPMIALVVLGILGLLVSLITDMAATSSQSMSANDALNAVAIIRKDIESSKSFFPSTLPSNYNITSPLTTTTTFQTQISSLPILLIETTDQIKNPINSTTTLPAKVGSGNTCNTLTDITNTNTLSAAIVYFVSNNILYRRVIPDNTNTPTCGTPLIHKNCPTTASDCAPKDTPILYNVKSFDITYFPDPAADYGYSPSYSPPLAVDTINTIVVQVMTKKPVASQIITYQYSQKITRK